MFIELMMKMKMKMMDGIGWEWVSQAVDYWPIDGFGWRRSLFFRSGCLEAPTPIIILVIAPGEWRYSHNLALLRPDKRINNPLRLLHCGFVRMKNQTKTGLWCRPNLRDWVVSWRTCHLWAGITASQSRCRILCAVHGLSIAYWIRCPRSGVLDMVFINANILCWLSTMRYAKFYKSHTWLIYDLNAFSSVLRSCHFWSYPLLQTYIHTASCWRQFHPLSPPYFDLSFPIFSLSSP